MVVSHALTALQPHDIVALNPPGGLQSENVAYLGTVVCVQLLGSLLTLLCLQIRLHVSTV